MRTFSESDVWMEQSENRHICWITAESLLLRLKIVLYESMNENFGHIWSEKRMCEWKHGCDLRVDKTDCFLLLMKFKF